MAGRLVRLDRHRQPAVVGRRRRLSAGRGLRGGVRRARQPRHHGRAVLPQRPGHRRRRRLPAHRVVEFRVGHRPCRVRRRRLLADGRRRDALGRPRACPTSRSRSSRATRSSSPTAGTCRASRAPAPTTTASRTCSSRTNRTFPLFYPGRPIEVASPASRMGLMPITAAGHASLGARRGQEHARRRRGTGRDEGPDERHGRRWPAGRPSSRDSPTTSSVWRAAQLLVLDAFTAAEAAVAAGDELTPALRADMRVVGRLRHRRGAERAPSGRTWPPAPTPSARAAGSSGPSATSTPAPSTRSSARRWPSTRHRSGSESSTTNPVCSRGGRAQYRYADRRPQLSSTTYDGLVDPGVVGASAGQPQAIPTTESPIRRSRCRDGARPDPRDRNGAPRHRG